MGGTMVDGTQLYHDAIKRIQQLEKLNATLSAEIDAQRQRGQATGEAYLRLRRLIGQRAFDTPYGPTAEQVWTITEIALADLVAEAGRQRAWKESAMTLLTRYDNLAETFGGRLGSSKVTNLENGVVALRAEVDRQRPVVEAAAKVALVAGPVQLGTLVDALLAYQRQMVARASEGADTL